MPPALSTGGVPAPIRKVSVPETPPPGAGLLTLILAVPAAVTFDAGTLACNCVCERKVVASALPFHSTVDPAVKFWPFTVMVKAVLPGVALEGDTQIAAGAGLL